MESSRLILSRIRAAYLVGALLLAGGPASAQDLAASLPLDLAIRSGTLPNGITFFIRHNSLPNDRVMLRLAVKAGSVDEDDDQRGLAHVVEHMAFAYRPTIAYFALPPGWALTLPAAAFLYMAMTLDSARRYWFGSGSHWKGRDYGRQAGAA